METSKKAGKWFVAGILLVGLVIGVALVSVGTSVVHWAGSTKFCGEFCHSMDAVYVAYQKGLHGKTKSGYQISCSDCHLKYESQKEISQAQVVGLLFHKAESGLSSLWGEIRGTMSTPEKQVEMRKELAEKTTNWMLSTGFMNCKGCHNFDNMENKDKPMVVKMHQSMAAKPDTNCVMCHKTAGHKYE